MKEKLMKETLSEFLGFLKYKVDNEILTLEEVQSIDTTVHELQHLAVGIASELGVDLKGENPAYIIGDTAQELFDVICKYGCEECRG